MRAWDSPSIRRTGLSSLLRSNSIHLNSDTREVSMQKPKHEPKPLMAGCFQAEARAVLAQRSGNASRFLDAALTKSRDIEPLGRLAG